MTELPDRIGRITDQMSDKEKAQIAAFLLIRVRKIWNCSLKSLITRFMTNCLVEPMILITGIRKRG